MRYSEYDYDEAIAPSLPPGRIQKTLLIGVVIGILSSIQGILITLANTPIYQKANGITPGKPSSSLPINIAYTLVGLFCLTLFISVLLYFIGGFITGKVAIQRRLGFISGFVAGAITYLVSFLTHYIPNYPGNLPSSGTGSITEISGGLLVSLIFLLLLGAFGGLISLLGARIATRRHPYYVGY